MICVSGPCLAKETESKHPIVSKYNLPVDITHYGGVKISSPEYDFFDNQLFQVGFKAECKADKARVCIDDIVNELDAQYGLEQIKDVYKEYSDQQAVHFYQYLTDTGAVIKIYWEKNINRWGYPSIKIYEKPLLDAVRVFSNPNYIPKELLRVASSGK